MRKLEGSSFAGGEPEPVLAGLLAQLGATVFRVNTATLEVILVDGKAGALAVLASGRAFWSRAVPEEDAGAVLEMIRAVADDGMARTMEHRLYGPGRAIAWVRTSFAQESPGVLLGAMLDITASRENERQWREAESWLVALSEALPFDFWICDRNGRCILQNPISAERIGGVVGERIRDGALRSAIDKALAGEMVREEIELARPTTPAHFVRVVSPVRNEKGIFGALGVDIEVTEVKQAEARLRQSLEQLAKAQDAVVRASQLAALGEMAAVVAHEVRNPLGSIQNAVALLRKGKKRSGVPLEELGRIIEDESARIEWLVRNLLELARPMVPELRPHALAPLVRDAHLSTLRSEGVEGRVQVVDDLDPRLAPILVDSDLLQLALKNALRNSVQAMSGQGVIQVRLEEDEVGWVRLTLQDSGKGISPEHESRLFEPFFTTRPSGNGLGLALIKRVVEVHGGTVALSSNPGEGARCVIRLPKAHGN